MRPISSGDRRDGHDPCDRAVEAFESLWQSGEPSLDRFWAELGPTRSLTVLGSLVKVDLQYRFNRGQRPSAADYMERFPDLSGSGDRVVSLIYEEFCLLEEHGEDPDSARFCELYGPWADSLRSQLIYHRELSRVVDEVAPTKFPKLGDRFAAYRLRALLGTGGAARVYLATEENLGGRKVALKVSASVGREPAILANLDHRNIVPILTVAESDTGLRGFCMPYRPGITLEELIRRIGKDAAPKAARAVWEALRPSDAGEIEGLEKDRPGWSDFPVAGTYPEAVAWIGLALAGALAYLHGRGVLHRDIKPANILLAYREGPQLLDFNLAHAPNAPEHAQAALKGGTLPYMAPEQLRAFLDPAGWDQVGAPADLYALGLVLRGLLTGQAPEVPNQNLPLPRAIRALHDRRSEPLAPVRQFNPGVPPALESIIAKCLEFDPSARYAGASDLAEDLRRFLARRPLGFASNTSMIERGVNCLYRNRLITAGLALLLVFLWIIRTPSARAVRDLPEFRRAVRDLESKDRADWERARAAFDRLRLAHPRSAWPWLYYGITLERIGNQAEANEKLGAANQTLWEAARWLDFEEALEQRLKEDPHSATLLTIQGLWILKDKLNEQRYQMAYPVLKRAIDADPDRIHALMAVAEVERNIGLEANAIRHFGRLLELGEANPKIPVIMINTCRRAMLPLLTHQADQQIDQGERVEERRKAAATLDWIEATRAALDREWQSDPPDFKPVDREFFWHFYGGAIASGRASLAGYAGEYEEARRGFDEARTQFLDALRAGEQEPQSGESIREQVDSKLKELEKRILRFARPAVVTPPVSGPTG